MRATGIMPKPHAAPPPEPSSRPAVMLYDVALAALTVIVWVGALWTGARLWFG